MINLTAAKNQLQVVTSELLTSGSVNVNTVQFTFNDDWDGLDKTAVFRSGEDERSVLLDDTEMCQIPWEVLQNKCRVLEAGVYGTLNGELVLPTVWVELGTIREGAYPGDSSEPPSPSIYEQILDIAQNAKDIAQSVRDDADAGEFDGPPGPPGPRGVGVPEITPDDEGKFLGVLDGTTAWILGGGGGGSGNVSSPDISTIRVMSRAEYDALETKSTTTLYFLEG